MKNCKHPIKKIEFFMETEVYEDDYGTLQSNSTPKLKCLVCKKTVNTILRGVSVEDYENLTDRELTLKEWKNLFSQNNNLFHNIVDGDKFKKEVMRNPKLEKSLQEKQKLIKKHTLDYYKLLKKYRGGTLDESSELEVFKIGGSLERILSKFGR